MRFSVFLSLVVAVFSVSCDGFVSAGTDARDDRLRENVADREERDFRGHLISAVESVLKYIRKDAVPPQATTTGEKVPIVRMNENGEKMPNSPHPRPDIEDTKVISESKATNWLKMLINQFDDKDKAMMMKKGYDVDKLSSANEENLRVIAQLILKGTKAQKPTFRKVAEKTGIAIGTLAVVYVLFLLATGRVHSPTLAPVGTTTSGGA